MAPPTTLILGGGIIGSSVAYHLSLRGAPSTVVEQQPRVATTASGKAAGFLAGGWGDGRVTERLHRSSFGMHEELAATLKLRSYRKLPTLKVEPNAAAPSQPSSRIVSWLDGDCVAQPLDDSTAQVDPHELCEAMMREAQQCGLCELRAGQQVVGIDTVDDDEGGRIATSVRLASGDAIACDQLVVALGPWSCLVESWLGVPMPVEGVWSTSLVYEAEDGSEDGAASATSTNTSPAAAASAAAASAVSSEPAALFVESDTRGCHLEVYPRASGEVYVAGCGESRLVAPETLRAGELPPSATNEPDLSRAAAAERSLAALSSAFVGRKSSRQQACVRPCAPDGLPIIGVIPGVANVHVATGHNAWGILWAPATGRAMAEVLLDGEAASLNLRAFAPRRFDTLTYRTLLKQRGRQKAGEKLGEQW